MNTIAGFILGLAPIILGSIFSLFIYNSWPNHYGIIGIGIVMILSFLVARSMFFSVIRLGGFEFISRVTASPDLDNLIPPEGGDVKLLELEEVEAHFQNEKTFSECSIALWGDWQGKPYVPNQEVKNVNYDKAGETLTIEFKSGSKLSVLQPEKLIISPSYLKILRASEIIWDTHLKLSRKSDLEKVSKNYQYSKKRIFTYSDPRGKIKFHASLGEIAVGLYGKLS
ncbi:MAG: hypothetical protein AB8H47_19210 [Bacteroidia bacterium]